MSISVTFNSTHRVLLASEFYLARRPVIDRRQQPVAHELLLCAPQQVDAGLPDQQPAAASVIADVCQHGLPRVIGDLHAILFVDHTALMSDLFRLLPANRIIVVLAPAPVLDAALAARLTELNTAGFRFALLAHAGPDVLDDWLPLVEWVRIDVSAHGETELARLAGLFRATGKGLLAERVDTPALFQQCYALGFDYFQGYHFAVPQIDPARRLTASESAIMRVMTLLASDADSAEIEHGLKSDVALGLKLLRMANAPAFGQRHIDSLRQALMVVGRNQLQRWLQLMLYAEAAPEGRAAPPLLAMAATRGRLAELVAQKLRPGNRGIADSAFTVGIMSLMDTLFSMPMEAILEQMPVSEDVSEALLARIGTLGKLLSLTEYTEWAHKNDAQLQLLLQDLRLASHDLYSLQLAAYEWGDAVARHARQD